MHHKLRRMRKKIHIILLSDEEIPIHVSRVSAHSVFLPDLYLQPVDLPVGAARLHEAGCREMKIR